MLKLRNRHLNCNIKSRKKTQHQFYAVGKLLVFNWLLGENVIYAIALIIIPLEPDESPCYISPSELNPALLNFSPSLMNFSSYDIKHVSMETKSISLRRQKMNNSCWILSLFFRDYFILLQVKKLQQQSVLCN